MRPDEHGSDGIIDLWLLDIEPPLHALRSLECHLDEDERTRAAGFVFEADRNRYIAGRGRLREILAHDLGIAPGDVRFAYNEYGKPSLDEAHGAALHFNLSHSAGLALLAVSDRYVLGADIEKVAPLKEDVAAHFFSDAERRDLAVLSEREYLDGFFRCWTRKEAFVKAHGEGLSLPLQSFDVSVGTEPTPLLRRLDSDPSGPENWKLFNLAPAAGFAAALAVFSRGRSPELRWRDLDEIADRPAFRPGRVENGDFPQAGAQRI